MPAQLTIADFLDAMPRALVVDVRSPGEFSRGHIPGAVNCPLFSDVERARVGTSYKQEGKLPAVLMGLEFVGPKMRDFAETVHDRLAQQPTDCNDLLVYCWRGGMRSSSFCWLLEQTGLQPSVLVGGYKSFRRAAQAAFAAERNIVVLSGMTGAGKTKKLSALAEAEEQVLDLESIAHHRGSSFGAIGLPPQPTCEQFENLVFMRLRELDPDRPVWIEDESPSIGKVRVPSSLWLMMRRSPAFFLEVDRETRAKNLAAEYGMLPQEQLAEATRRLEKKLGGLRMKEIITDLERGLNDRAAIRLLEYYDKSYQHAAKRKPRERVIRIDGGVSATELRTYPQTKLQSG